MIRIEKDKLLYTNHRNETNEIYQSDITKYLKEEIEIGEGVTFKRIFDILLLNRKKFDIIFSSSTGRYPLNLYFTEYLKDDDDDDPDSITYLEIYNYCEVFNWNDVNEIDRYVGFHGIREDYTDKYTTKPFDAPISISFTSINNLKKYEIRINNEAKYIKHIEKEGYKNILSGTQVITLFEFYDAILHEISWHGTPKERQERVDDLNKTVDRIDNGEEETFELKFEDNKVFSIDKDGNKKLLFDDPDEKEE